MEFDALNICTFPLDVPEAATAQISRANRPTNDLRKGIFCGTARVEEPGNFTDDAVKFARKRGKHV